MLENSAQGKNMMERPHQKKRDVRLLMVLLLFVASTISGLVQAWILQLYFDAAVSGNWAYFAKTFSVQPPASGPDVFCLGHCAADLPFLAGWIAIVSFVLGVIVLIYSWWKPWSLGR